MRSAAEPREERPDAEAESLRRTVAELAALERRLRTELETERGSHQADVSRLEAEIEAQGTRLAERNLENRELRGQLKALRGKRRALDSPPDREAAPGRGPARPPPASRRVGEQTWTRIALAVDRVRLCDRRSAAV